MIHAEVLLWGSRIGALTLRQDSPGVAVFEYDPVFVSGAQGIEPSPLSMKRRQGLFSFPEESLRTFHGLPGMFVDCLPDKFGTSLLDRWFAENGRNPAEVNIIERLLYMADRAMGALTFRPARNLVEPPEMSVLNLVDLAELANAAVSRDEAIHEALKHSESTQTALDLIRVGTSAGGARAKALIAEDTEGSFYPGHIVYETPHRYWLMKFGGVTDNADRDGSDPPGMTAVEYVYSLIARDAGIRMPDTRLLESGSRRHFLIERFDRIPSENPAVHRTDRLHFSSWCGIAHAHRDWPGAYSYEQLALVCRQLGLPHEDLEQLYRRAVYNIIGVNHDDHTKNFGFLMNRQGQWRLSPAFDLTYACDPTGRWTNTHQTALNGKTSGHNRQDLKAFASHCSLTGRDAEKIISEVLEAFSFWGNLADEYSVPAATVETVTVMQRRVAKELAP